LFKLIIGEEYPDSGIINIPKNYRIGYVRQHLELTEDTILKEGMRGLGEHERDHHWKVERILSGLGFSQSDMQRHPSEFSGGFQVRLNLAKALISEPDLLLLDEPTNYLDIESIRWVEKFLCAWPHEVMLITHDRSFMDKVVTHIIGIHRRQVRKIAGNTEKFYAQLAQDEEVYEKTRINDEKKRKEIELFISRFRAKARLANLVQSRIKTLSKIEKRDKLDHIKTLDFFFRYQPFPGKIVMTAESVSFSYNSQTPLIQSFDITVRHGERICVIGRNGKGKTTLLKILGGILSPDTGEVSYSPNVAKGIYEQTNIDTLVSSWTVEEEIVNSDAAMDKQQARNICGAMMFEGDAALKKIGVLSGGEKSRVMLGKLLATPLNLLMLDEPTNHLDMESCDALVAALDNFKGALVMVTHNEMFLHALAERLIVFRDGQIAFFDGSYSEFLEKGGWGDDNDVRQQKDSDKKIINKKELRRMRSEIIAERSKATNPVQDRIRQAENEIERHEKQIHDLNADMQSASELQDRQRITEISQALFTAQTAIDNLFDDLEKLTMQYEELSADFEKRLLDIDAG
jgi:ATP-binding cassette subfamily F protein 3